MKTNGNDFAFSTLGTSMRTSSEDGIDAVNPPLTKREHFAAMAMQGLCANYLRENVTGWDIKTYATEAVALSDALIHELNKTQEGK